MKKDGGGIEVLDGNKMQIMKITTDELTEKYQYKLNNHLELTYDEAINIKENEDLKVQFILKNISVENRNNDTYYYFEFYILIHLK